MGNNAYAGEYVGLTCDLSLDTDVQTKINDSDSIFRLRFTNVCSNSR